MVEVKGVETLLFGLCDGVARQHFAADWFLFITSHDMYRLQMQERRNVLPLSPTTKAEISKWTLKKIM